MDMVIFLGILTLVVIIGFILFQPCPEGTTFAVKEITPEGNILQRLISQDTPSMTLGITTDSGEPKGTVPLEGNKKYRERISNIRHH